MKTDNILRDILPSVLIDNFDILKHEKSDSQFDIWLNEKKVQLEEDKYNPNIISHGFTSYRTIQDYPIRGRACYLHVCKRKWLNRTTGEIFTYKWDLSEHDKSKLNAEFVAFLKEGY
ncbi:MAG: ISAon1 family transposase N-terminal region protein [Bacteroidales bacterium]